MPLAAVIAGYGLLSNSAAVVIGAMLVAMMLGPISGIALALIDNRWLLFKTALSTLLLGVAMIYSIGIILGLVNYDLPMTNEIFYRAHSNHFGFDDRFSRRCRRCFCLSIPSPVCGRGGVAVATALVPPLVASGILFAHMEWKNSANAFLLAVTNIFAIQISSSLVLWIAGFRRAVPAKKCRVMSKNFSNVMLLA